MGYENHWLNIIEIEEMIEKLILQFKPLFSKRWATEQNLEHDLLQLRNKFFLNNKNYDKYQHSIIINFSMAIQPSTGNNSYFILKKINIERI